MGSELDRRFQDWYTEDVKRYDTRFQGTFAQLESQFILDLIRPEAAMTILDVGTGTGRASLTLASRSQASVVGLDLTLAMLGRASQKRDDAGLTYPLFVCGNGRSLPFESNSFDAVLSIRTLHLFPISYWDGFIGEMVRVLKPGGTLLVEFDSALAGFGWGLIRDIQRRWTRDKNRYYLWPQRVGSLFTDVEDREVYGFWLPGIGRLARRNPRYRRSLRFARLQPPFGFLGNHVLVRARKPISAVAESGSKAQLATVSNRHGSSNVGEQSAGAADNLST